MIPDDTILIENPAAVTTEAQDPEAAQALLDFILTDEGQQIFADYGYRPVVRVGPRSRTRTRSRRSPACSRSTNSAAGTRSTTSSSTTRPARSRRSSVSRGTARVEAIERTRDDTSARRHSGCDPAEGGPQAPSAGRCSPAAIVVTWLSVIVLIPLGAVVLRSPTRGWRVLGRDLRAGGVAAIRLTVITSLIIVAINAVMGTLIAWVLVRDDFRGKRIVNSIIDLPFALPTIVAGLTLLALYGQDCPIGINVTYTKSRWGWRCCS